MTYKDRFLLVLLHTEVFILSSVLFIVFFRLNFLPNLVFFYRGIIFILTISLFVFSFMSILRFRLKSRYLDMRDVFLATILFSSINLVFFTHVPVTADRSVTISMLRNINDNFEHDENEISGKFISEYVYKNGAMQKRLNEQVVTGNVMKIGDKFIITSQGKKVMKFYDLIANTFKVKIQ